MTWCNVLGSISQADYVDRRYLTPEHQKANQQVAEWLANAGCSSWQDGAANLWGRYPSHHADAPRLILGSHLDTVPNGGKYDGMLGVLLPVALVSVLNQHKIKLPFHIDIVGFGDEEGTRFGTTLLGSRALTGKWQQEWSQLTDNDGITLAQAMSDFGLSFDAVENCVLETPSSVLAYLEVHIEQGPVLEDKNLPVGVVTAINGARRFMFNVQGNAGHAGTVPMELRQDALVATAEMILQVEAIAKHFNVVATVGSINNNPNGVNVIPGHTQFSVDIRSENDNLRDKAFTAMLEQFTQIAVGRGLKFDYQQTHSADAVLCAQRYQKLLCQAIERVGVEAFSLASGAGHDAMAMADICDVAMLFVRCDKGISHHPAEAIQGSDVETSLNVMNEFLILLAEQITHKNSEIQ